MEGKQVPNFKKKLLLIFLFLVYIFIETVNKLSFSGFGSVRNVYQGIIMKD